MLFGYGLLLLSLPPLLALVPFPDVRGALPAGGMLGDATRERSSGGLQQSRSVHCFPGLAGDGNVF